MDGQGPADPRNQLLDEVAECHHCDRVVVEQRVNAVSHPINALFGVIVDAVPLDDIPGNLDVLANRSLGDCQNNIAPTQGAVTVSRTG